MAIPNVTREYTAGACRNSRKLRRLPPRRKMRPDSPAFRAEEFCVPNQRRKEPRFPSWNWIESPGILSQQGKNTDVTLGIQNRLVYPKSTQDEAHFPFFESIAISHSTLYTTSGLTSSTKIQRFPETHLKSIGTSISAKQHDENSGHLISSEDESWFPVFDWRGKPSFQKHLKRSLPIGICMWEGPCVLCFKQNGRRDALIQKKAKFPCRGFMHAHRSYHKMKGCLRPL